MQRLELELDSCDEVLLSEELNVLLRKQEELNEEMNELRLQLTDCDSHIRTEHKQSQSLNSQLEHLDEDNKNIDKEIKSSEDEMDKLQKRVEEKKRWVQQHLMLFVYISMQPATGSRSGMSSFVSV